MKKKLQHTMCGFILCIVLLSLGMWPCYAQHYSRTDTIPVYANSDTLKFPWAGGHNYSQFSDIDFNFDGIKDLFVFDRTGNKITTYINGGTPNTVDYTHAPKYEKMFPSLQNWALLADYNCDGKEDIFTSSINPSGIRVYKNISTSSSNFQFTLVKTTLYEGINYIPANNIGLPVIEDIDADGDLDILTFSTGNMTMDYYINQSIEMGYNCDSLIFSLDPPCWGHFSESGSLCTVVLTSCRIGNPDPNGRKESKSSPSPSGGGREGASNGSSCSLCLDMDGDGDKELLIGQGGCCTMTLLTNGGTSSSANMTSFTSGFPSGTMPVNVRYNPCGYFLDVNNDAKRDLIISPSAQNVSVNNESIWYYKNIGADNAPVFDRQTRSFLQEDMIDRGAGANPAFFDFDNDGLTDLLISNYAMTYDSCPSASSFGVVAYKNIGSSTVPEFNLTSTDYANLSSALSGITNKHLTFGDLDSDGDADMFIGDYNGFIHYFENTGGAGPANFSLLPVMNYLNSAGVPIDIGSSAAPQLIDADRDGDLDLIIGEQAGNLNYYQNIGTSASPSFTLITNSFGGVDVLDWNVTGYSVPFMYDSSGVYRLLVASEASRASGSSMGWIWYYKNIDGNLAGSFTLADSMYYNIWEGIRMAVNGKDITGDGRMDLVIGNYAGGVAIYLGDTLSTGISELNDESCDFAVYPNPFSETTTLRITCGHLSGTNYVFKLFDVVGREVHVDFIRNSDSFVIRSGNLLQGIYFCRVSGENISTTKKLIVLK